MNGRRKNSKRRPSYIFSRLSHAPFSGRRFIFFSFATYPTKQYKHRKNRSCVKNAEANYLRSLYKKKFHFARPMITQNDRNLRVLKKKFLWAKIHLPLWTIKKHFNNKYKKKNRNEDIDNSKKV